MDGFLIVTEGFKLTPQNCRLESLQKKSQDQVEATYRSRGCTVTAAYTLSEHHHFCEKRLTLSAESSCRLKSLSVIELDLAGAPLRYVRYQYQKNATYFARSPRGGLFFGLEVPYDDSTADESGIVTLAYRPSLKLLGSEPYEFESAYVGAYLRHPGDKEEPGLPLASESAAMVTMTSALAGPPRHGLIPMACGWWCEMEHQTYRTEAQVGADMQSIDFLAECGVDWLTDCHPWSGEIDKMNSLRAMDHYQPGPLVGELLEHARSKKVNVIFWPTMTNTDPWWKEKGRPFRADRPDWTMFPNGQTISATIETGRTFKQFVRGNCIANTPFWNWLMGLQQDGMRTGYFSGWVMDGDFLGGGGIVISANCPSDRHDHLPGDSNYACERALNRMISRIRSDNPNAFIGPMCRPAQDLGIWSNLYADGVFTLNEFGLPRPLPGLDDQPLNIIMGDKARAWSRIRVHRNFSPHYLDQPLVFAAPKSMKGPEWTSEKIDYVMLSALSSSPRQLYYLPTKAGIPTGDKAANRRWIDWGRKNVAYLKVRRDLPQWPAAQNVDGSAHIVGDRGLIFLFNPNPQIMPGKFRLDPQSIGLIKGSRFAVAQLYPPNKQNLLVEMGRETSWNVPPQSAVVLSIHSA